MIFANRKGGNAASAEETQLVQELLQGLRRLEERMNSLETILLERGRKD
jgi:phage shock protein B